MVQKEIIHIRLVNGEELIAEIADRSTDEVFIKNPYVIIETATQITLQKYVPFQDEQVMAVKNIHIIMTTQLHPELIRYYENSKYLASRITASALEGLARVNDQLEEYIYSPDAPVNIIEDEPYIQKVPTHDAPKTRQ